MAEVIAPNRSVKIDDSWKQALADEFSAEYFSQLKQFLQAEKKAGQTVYPPGPLIFNAFNLTPFDKVKVVILGQDPYHGPNQAMGLAFSVQKGVPCPPSLQNIFKEIEADLNITQPGHGDLSSWAKQGVLLLNTVLTVRQGEAHSHQGQGWEQFTDAVITKLSAEREGLIFVLWGSPAKAKKKLIDTQKHFILESVHPSPLSAYRGFLGCKHFSKINELLFQHKKMPISWGLAN